MCSTTTAKYQPEPLRQLAPELDIRRLPSQAITFDCTTQMGIMARESFNGGPAATFFPGAVSITGPSRAMGFSHRGGTFTQLRYIRDHRVLIEVSQLRYFPSLVSKSPPGPCCARQYPLGHLRPKIRTTKRRALGPHEFFMMATTPALPKVRLWSRKLPRGLTIMF